MKPDPVVLQAERRILLIRRQRVMLSDDLAALYGVETKALNRAVKRNAERFPADFMFQLIAEEAEDLKCQFGTSSWGGSRVSPYAFTEQGVAMLSSVLRSRRAVQVNIAIVRAFVRLREMLLTNAELARQMADLEQKYDSQFNLKNAVESTQRRKGAKTQGFSLAGVFTCWVNQVKPVFPSPSPCLLRLCFLASLR